MVKVLIQMDGGIIQSITSDEPIEVYVIDYDTEGVENDHPFLTSFDGDECLLGREKANIDPGLVYLAAKTWETI